MEGSVAHERIYVICECGKATVTGLFMEATDILTARENFKNRVTNCKYCKQPILLASSVFTSESYAKAQGKIA